jgi:hypothetical protein
MYSFDGNLGSLKGLQIRALYTVFLPVLSRIITPPPLRVGSRESVSLIPCLPALGVGMTFPRVQISCNNPL